MNKDYKILAEAYDQIVKNQFDIKHTDAMPGGGLKTEDSPGGLVKTEAEIPSSKPKKLRSYITVYVEGVDEEELTHHEELLKQYIDEERKTTDWIDRDQDFERDKNFEG
jgi:hypothetical protein